MKICLKSYNQEASLKDTHLIFDLVVFYKTKKCMRNDDYSSAFGRMCVCWPRQATENGIGSSSRLGAEIWVRCLLSVGSGALKVSRSKDGCRCCCCCCPAMATNTFTNALLVGWLHVCVRTTAALESACFLSRDESSDASWRYYIYDGGNLVSQQHTPLSGVIFGL